MQPFKRYLFTCLFNATGNPPRPSEARVDNPALPSAHDSPHTPGLGLARERGLCAAVSSQRRHTWLIYLRNNVVENNNFHNLDQHTKGESLISYIRRKNIECLTETFEWTSLKQKPEAILLIHNLTFQRMGGKTFGNSTTGLADKH